MVEFRMPNGDAWLFPYALLLWVQWDRGGRIVLRFSTHTVTITGRNLRPVHEAVAGHRLESLQAEGIDGDNGEQHSTCVYDIAVVADKKAKREAANDPPE